MSGVKKGTYHTKEGVVRFLNPGTEMGPPAKKWFQATVTRKTVNGKGEVVKRNKQTTTIFANESNVPALAMRQCPSDGPTEGDVQVNVYYRPLSGEDNL